MGFCLALAAHPWLWKRFYGGGWVEDEERLRVAQIELGLLDASTKLTDADPQLGDFRYDYAMKDWPDVENREREIDRMEVYAA